MKDLKAANLAWSRGPVGCVFAAALLYSALGVLSHVPGIGLFANYLGIAIGVFVATAYVLLNISSARLTVLELALLFALIFFAVVSLLQSQDPVDIGGNFIRGAFIISAIVFWRLFDIEVEQLTLALYRALWLVSLTASFLIITMKVGGAPISEGNHIPALVFVFAVALWRRRYWQVLALFGLAFVSGKDAIFIAFFAIALFATMKRGWLPLSIFLTSVFGLYFLVVSVSPVFLALQSTDGKFAEVSEALWLMHAGLVDEHLLNKISSNRYLEYQSVFRDWSENGIPFFGRGLGGTVLVELEWLDDVAERSTLHNSYLVVLHTTGIFGLAFLIYFVLLPIWVTSKRFPDLYLAIVGYVVYALFSNTLLQAPSAVFTIALAHCLSKRANSAKMILAR